MKDDGVKRIDIKEFRFLGFLQEVNRKFFHPLGLALEVIVNDDGTEELGGVWDYRDDEEGIFFSKDIMDKSKANYVEALRLSKVDFRKTCDNAGEVDESGIQQIS